MELQRQVHRFHLRGFAHDAGRAGNRALQHGRGNRRGGEDEGNARKEVIAMAQYELKRRRRIRDDHVEGTPPELDADGLTQGRVRRVRKLLVLQVLRIRLDGDRRVREQRLADRRVEREVSRKDLGATVNDQHPFHRRLRHEGRGRHEASDDGGREETSASAEPEAHQKDNFATSWIWRDEPASPVGRRVREIFPNVGLPTTFPGGPRFGWLNRSNASARSCRR